MSTASTGGAKYFVVFMDDKSRWREVHFIAKKSQVLAAFKKYMARVENLLELTLVGNSGRGWSRKTSPVDKEDVFQATSWATYKATFSRSFRDYFATSWSL